MFRAYKLGKAFAIPLYIHPTFLLLPLAFLAWTARQGLAAVLLTQAVLLTVFACVLLHELGHALAARAFGIRTRDIALYPIGGVARLESTGERPVEEVVIALAGPAVNLALVLLLAPVVVLAWAAGRLATLPGQYVAGVAASNIGLMIFNLLPVFPMDGGRVLRALLWSFLPRLTATAIAAYVGLALAGGLTLLGVLWNRPILVGVTLFVAFAGQAELSAMRRMEERPAPPAPAPDPRLAGFTGMAWDPAAQAWVPWADGGPPA